MSEHDFTVRQHVESLTPASDPSLAEVMNNYKFPPASPPAPPNMAGFNGYPPYLGIPPAASSNNDMLLGNILGQLQANQQRSQFDGFQLNINMKVLAWILIILLLAILIWLVLRVQQNRKNPLKRRLRKLEKEFKKMRRFRRKNPKALKADDLDKIEDALDDFDDLA